MDELLEPAVELPKREPRSQVVGIARAEIALKINEMAKERGLTYDEVIHILLHEAYHMQASRI